MGAGNLSHDAATSERNASLRAIPQPGASAGPVPLLTEDQRRLLRLIATDLHLPRRSLVYEEGAPADFVYIVGEGTAKAYRDFASGRRRIVNFLTARDLFGLAENGRYVNTVQTVTRCLIHRMAIRDVLAAFQADPGLEYKFLLKVAQELRDAQRQAIMTGRRDASGRVAMLLAQLERDPCAPAPPGEIALPMSRSDLADYLGLSLEAVSRACRQLRDSGILAFPSRTRARVLDRERFERLISSL
jgi:CRP-like cAMP-binding protein